MINCIMTDTDLITNLLSVDTTSVIYAMKHNLFVYFVIKFLIIKILYIN